MTATAARAADALVRLGPQPRGAADWLDYHARFLVRYGAGAVVAVEDLIDPATGLGLPAHYASPPGESLADRRAHLTDTLAELAQLLPELPELDVQAGGIVREISLEELAQNGAIFIRRGTPQPADHEKDTPGPRVQGRILTSQDLARAVPPSGTGGLVADDVRNSPIREGDVLVPTVGRRLTARVAADQDVGAYLSPSVYLIRPDATTIDPWFLAGVLSSTGGGNQAARMASTLGDHIRFEPRRVRVPLLPIDVQRAYGETFRRLWDFARTFRAAHDEGIDFVRDLIDTTASSISETAGLAPMATSPQRPRA